MSENELIAILCGLLFFTGMNTLYIILQILGDRNE